MYELINYGILVALCTGLVFTYSAPSVSPHVKFWSIVTWVLNFGMCLIVPGDVYITLKASSPQAQHNTIQQQSDKIMFEYLLLYWTVYLLTWTIIPVLQEWENSGDLRSEDRLKRSLRVNGIFYLYMLVAGLGILGLLYFFNVGGDMGLRTYLKCLATCWGVLLQMMMMGYAMVEIPRSLWISGHPDQYLRYCYRKVHELEEQQQSSLFEFKQITSFILHSKKLDPQSELLLLYCENSLALIPPQLSHHIPNISYSQYINHLNYVEAYPVGIQSSIEHHRLMKRILARYRRVSKTLEHFIDDSILYEDIVEAISEGKSEVRSVVMPSGANIWMRSVWHLRLAPVFYRSLAVLISLLSAIILVSQTQLFMFSDQNSTSILGWLLLFEDLETLRFLIYLLIIFISYMVYYSLFRIKLSNIYGLYKHESDGPSLMFTTINFSRVAFAIVLNFFQMIKLDGIYVKSMGTVEMGLLGEWVIKGIPGVLWLIVLTHYYDIWGKIITKLSLSDDLRFATHKLDDPEASSTDRSVPFLVRKKRISLRIQTDQKNCQQLQQKLIP